MGCTGRRLPHHKPFQPNSEALFLPEAGEGGYGHSDYPINNFFCVAKGEGGGRKGEKQVFTYYQLVSSPLRLPPSSLNQTKVIPFGTASSRQNFPWLCNFYTCEYVRLSITSVHPDQAGSQLLRALQVLVPHPANSMRAVGGCRTRFLLQSKDLRF
jgi:hypothetical protein